MTSGVVRKGPLETKKMSACPKNLLDKMDTIAIL